MNSENSKTFKPHVLILKLTDKSDLRRSWKKYCFIKSTLSNMLFMEKHEKLIQQ